MKTVVPYTTSEGGDFVDGKMKETITEIRELLSRLECEAVQSEKRADFRALSSLELPDIICDVVDLLFPELKPYEAALYMHLFRHSIIQTGSPYVRASGRNLQTAVARAVQRGGETQRRENSVRKALVSLIEIAAIRQEADANRDGTLYRVLLPEEIEVCRKRRAETSQKNTPTAATEAEADFYNVRENRIKIYERDNYKCRHCGKQLTRFTATLDHVQAVSEGGDNSAENLVTACLSCNSRKNSRPLGDFMAEQR
jgi:hypothetical protein